MPVPPPESTTTPARGRPAALSPGGRPWLRRLVRVAIGLLAVVAVAVAVFVVATRNPTPGAFYEPPDDLSGPAGTVMRSEPFEHGLPDGARAWRVLYTSTDDDGDPIAVSGLIVAPTDPTGGPHPVLAWAHGTTGIARPCAPSLTDDPLAGIPDMAAPLEQGWVVALTDYPGLGTPGPHPYLGGASAGRAVLDSVRAAHDLDTGMDLSDEYAIWGHSQGGHAALFAGQLAEDHLSDQDLAGVVALAPATRLVDDFEALQGTQIGNVLTILAVDSWSAYYPELSTDILTPDLRRRAGRMGRDCLNQPSRFRLLLAGLRLPRTITVRDVTDDPAWSARLDENTPDPAGMAAPLLVEVGLADEVIAPAVTRGWVEDRCATGAATQWSARDGVDHLDIVGPGGTDALAWTVDRFDGAPAPNRCPG